MKNIKILAKQIISQSLKEMEESGNKKAATSNSLRDIISALNSKIKETNDKVFEIEIKQRDINHELAKHDFEGKRFYNKLDTLKFKDNYDNLEKRVTRIREYLRGLTEAYLLIKEINTIKIEASNLGKPIKPNNDLGEEKAWVTDIGKIYQDKHGDMYFSDGVSKEEWVGSDGKLDSKIYNKLKLQYKKIKKDINTPRLRGGWED